MTPEPIPTNWLMLTLVTIFWIALFTVLIGLLMRLIRMTIRDAIIEAHEEIKERDKVEP